MKYFLFSFFAIGMMKLHAQQNNVGSTGMIDSIRSDILKEQRKIWVHLPASARDTANGKKYPVVYLLDAEKNFTSVTGMIDFLSSVIGDDVCPEMIVVAIPNTDRTRDLTPTRVTSGLFIDEHMASHSGGGEAFLQFIEKELMPHIDSLYPVTRYRMLIGHSLGGLMVIDALTHHRKMFDSYVAIDPSLWWDKQHLLHEAEASLQKNSYAGKALYLGMANTIPGGMDTATVQKDTTGGTTHPRAILELGKFTRQDRLSGLDAGFKYYDSETHGTIPLIATYDALHFIFKDYPLKFKDSYFTDSTFALAEYIDHYFEHITSKYGLTSGNNPRLLPREDWLLGLGRFVMGKKHYSKALDLFQLDIRCYPNSFKGYDAIGDLYAARNDKALARIAYKKSLSFRETPETSDKLKKLDLP